MNTTPSNNSTECVLDTSVTAVLFPCLYSAVFLVALVLNSLAAWIFYNIHTTSTFVVYLKNVVVADILMTLTLPVKVLILLNEASVASLPLCVFYCRYSVPLFYLSMYTSILYMGLISVDRYLKIVRPFGRYAVQKVRVGKVLSAAVWAATLSLGLPVIILADKPPQRSRGVLNCVSMWRSLHLKAAVFLFSQVVFFGTLVLMLVCYTFISRKVYESYTASRSSSGVTGRRIKAKVFLVVAVFFICFAPSHFALIPYTLPSTAYRCTARNAIDITYETTMWLSTMNVCLDPLIYIFLCKTFRRKLTATLSRKPPAQGNMDMCVTVC